MSDLQFHELAGIFPLLAGAEFDDLVEDIRAHGVREPVVLHDGLILDGRNRYRASKAAGVDCPLSVYDGADPLAYVVSLNLKRRHLTESQRAMVAAAIANLKEGRPAAEAEPTMFDQTAQICAVSQTAAAEMLNVSRRSVQAATVVKRDGAPELVAEVERGNVAVSVAADVARLPQAEQREIVAKGEKEILAAAKDIRSKRAVDKKRQNAELKKVEVPLPAGKYEVIVVDPPWPMEKIERDVRPNQVAFEYPTMTEAELVEFGARVETMAAEDCHLFMWTTQRFLPLAIRLTAEWGFRYLLVMVWHKKGGFQPIGLPQFNCEFVVYGRKGSPKFVETKAFDCCFEAPRRKHSEKPKEFYELIERVTDGRRIDVFSRGPHRGFDQFGNEVAT